MQVDPLVVLKKLASSYDIKCLRVAAPFAGLEDFDYGLRKALDPQFEWQEFGKLLVQSTAENVLTVTEDMFELQYALFRIPDEPESVFLMGPWTNGTRTNETSEWIRKHIGKQACEVVQNYYSSVRVVQDNRFISTVSTIVGLMMPPDEYRVVEKREFLPLNFALDTRFFQEPSFEQELPQTMLEERYATENKLIDAVSRGDVDAAINVCHQMGRYTYNGRFFGTLYQIKTKMTIMNTLMRKAIERGKVHPYYIDKISSRYAAQIECITDLNDPSMIWDMVRQYCAYVQRYSVKDYTAGAKGHQPYQPESGRADVAEKPCCDVLYQPVLSVQPVQAGHRHDHCGLHQHPAGRSCRRAAGNYGSQNRRRGCRRWHSGRELLYQDFQKTARHHTHPVPPRKESHAKRVICAMCAKRQMKSPQENTNGT